MLTSTDGQSGGIRRPRARQYRQSDDAHAAACIEIAGAHPELALAALMRLLDLADQGVDRALVLVLDTRVRSLLGASSAREMGPYPSVRYETLPAETLAVLHDRVRGLFGRGHYLVPLIHDEFDTGGPGLRLRRYEAKDRILNRPTPDPSGVEFGTLMVEDSSLVGGLDAEDRRRCLARLLAIAEDLGEVASNRQEALIAARNLVLGLGPEDTGPAFLVAEQFALGAWDGSRLDELAGEPHPLSSFKMKMGSASLRGSGLRLAAAAVSTDDQHAQVRDHAVDMLHSDDKDDVQAATRVLVGLPRAFTTDLDADLLSIHQHANVRQLASVLSARNPHRYRGTLMRLAKDVNPRVRRVLAEEVSRAPEELSEAVRSVREILLGDSRFSVRIAARGRDRREAG
ncbi:hypothetical protein [Kitasatospora sp. NPDC002965]|uniref:hypothetical protein n=1 Tax=Kitasatospora sp. NPDC002965 TaxID=3154775 RepID=UPI0033B01C7D